MKLPRPRWISFSLQSSQKLSDKDMCDWVKNHMSDVFCHPQTTTVSTWKKLIEKEKNAPKVQEPEAITGKKRGPRTLWANKEHQSALQHLLCILASMIVAEYNSGFPLSSILLSCQWCLVSSRYIRYPGCLLNHDTIRF